MKRVGVLAGLLVLALGSGVVAQDAEPVSSPGATPLFAPEDLSYFVPPSVGDLELSVMSGGLEDLYYVVSWPLLPEDWRDILVPLGKEPSSVTLAEGHSEPIGKLSIAAYHVDGVPAEALMESMLGSQMAMSDPDPEVELEWQVLGDKRVWVFTEGVGNARVFFYPKGEVLFLVLAAYADGPSPEDVLAELP